MRRFSPAYQRISCLLVLCAVLLSACLPEPAQPTPVTPTATATITPTATATIIWFPATATFTPAPTMPLEPTPDMRPGLGSLLFEDAFIDKTQWQTSRTASGSVAYGRGELTLAVAEMKATLLSLRKTPQLGDYYLEIEALPSLCRGDDSFGLLLRANSSQDFYRLVLSCAGQVRMERLKSGKVAPMQDWVTSGAFFPGGMLPVRLGVWVLGEEMRVFINGVYQFTAKDPVFTSGVLGVFARSAGDTPLTVSFSRLSVYAINAGQARPRTTPTPAQKPTATRRPSATPAKK